MRGVRENGSRRLRGVGRLQSDLTTPRDREGSRPWPIRKVMRLHRLAEDSREGTGGCLGLGRRPPVAGKGGHVVNAPQGGRWASQGQRRRPGS